MEKRRRRERKRRGGGRIETHTQKEEKALPKNMLHRHIPEGQNKTNQKKKRKKEKKKKRKEKKKKRKVEKGSLAG